MPHYTNRWEALSPMLAIAWSDNGGTRRNYPTRAQKTLLINGAAMARKMMRRSVWWMDKVVFFRRPETQPFTSIMNYYFGLAANRLNPMLADNIVNKPFSRAALWQRDRRSILNKVRMGMLSVSFHLNTGVYLIDVDIANRNIIGGVADRPGAGEEGYVVGGRQIAGVHHPHDGLWSWYKNGEIHVAFELMEAGNYTAQAVARVIIHEASHKHWATADHAYAHQTATYQALTCEQAIDNADSYAWAALSMGENALVEGNNSIDLNPQAVPVP